jgi:hypothetical protein
MQQYADLLTARLQQRQAMRAAEAVPLSGGRAPRDADDSDFDDDEPQQASQQQVKAAKASTRQRVLEDTQVGPCTLQVLPRCLWEHWLVG